jgi:acetyl-CoA carboxylase carboxyl transferase subunit beta
MLTDLFKKTRYVTISRSIPNQQAVEPDSAEEELVYRCPKCKKAVFKEEYQTGNKVCKFCGFHDRLTALERLFVTVDNGEFEELFGTLKTQNPIGFDGYEEKIAGLSKKTGINEAVVTAKAKIGGNECLVGVMDSNFMMASMGSVVGEKLARLFEKGIEEKLPVIVFCASGGARMHEGIISLMQMAKVSAAVKKHSDSGLLYITVLTDPVTGGVTASFASLGDIIISEPKALIGFAGRRVIEGTIGEKLPEDFQTAEFLLKHGFIDLIVKRGELNETLAKLLSFHKKEEIV